MIAASEVSTQPKRKNWKYLLPSYYRLPNYRFDIAKIRAEVELVKDHYKNVVESNRELCSNNHELVESVYDHYEQVSLTTFNGDTSKALKMEDCVQLGQTAGVNAELTKHQKYRIKIGQRLDRPELDERNYTKPTKEYQGSYIQSCVEQFGAEVLRVRLVKLKAGKMVDWHIDYDPSFATRIIVPVITNEKVINSTRRRGQVESVHMPADGHAWFLNTGFSHSVVNAGDSDRVILMFSLNAPHLLETMARAVAGSLEHS